jgi:hypothetical protein
MRADFVCYANLAQAIVVRAVDDWRYICEQASDITSDGKQHTLIYGGGYRSSFRDLQDFFESEWCDTLCGGVSTSRIMMRLRQERQEAIKKSLTRPKRQAGVQPKYHEYNGESHTLTEWSKILREH